ncbi:MAG TPA: hypothetical protein VMI06_14320 [Terriglobia bacterium]|nr:hypothetical protein [Terriglobia bacterium]
MSLRNVLEAFKQQRLGLASAITAGALLIVFFHAPLVPVALGCVLALGLLVYRSAANPQRGDKDK